MASERREPVRRAESFSFVHNGQFYVCHGRHATLLRNRRQRQPYREFQLRLPLQRFDFSFAQWNGVLPVSVDHEREERRYWTDLKSRYLGACSAVLGNCVYTFGGFRWRYGYAVHELNLETMVWRRLEPENREDGPMVKNKAGMVTCGDEALCVFGGYGPDDGRHQPGATYHTDHRQGANCWTNELHVFHPKKGTWSSPETTGPRPPPCAGFSFTKVDTSRAVLFGGEQRDKTVNEVHILHMDTWHWSGAILPTSPADPWPQARALHSACALFDPQIYSTTEQSSRSTLHSRNDNVLTDSLSGQLQPKLFILWGTVYRNVGLASDAWILDVNSLTWKQVKLPPVLGEPRWSFSLGCHNRSPTEAELVVFGGFKYDFTADDDVIIGGTTLFCLGVRSLYHICVEYIAEKYEFNDSLLQRLLPPCIQTDINQERDKRANIVRYQYRVAQL